MFVFVVGYGGGRPTAAADSLTLRSRVPKTAWGSGWGKETAEFEEEEEEVRGAGWETARNRCLADAKNAGPVFSASEEEMVWTRDRHPGLPTLTDRSGCGARGGGCCGRV